MRKRQQKYRVIPPKRPENEKKRMFTAGPKTSDGPHIKVRRLWHGTVVKRSPQYTSRLAARREHSKNKYIISSGGQLWFPRCTNVAMCVFRMKFLPEIELLWHKTELYMFSLNALRMLRLYVCITYTCAIEFFPVMDLYHFFKDFVGLYRLSKIVEIRWLKVKKFVSSLFDSNRLLARVNILCFL